MNIREFLAAVREKTGLRSSRALAREAGLSLAGLQRIEHGGLPSDATMMRLSRLAGVKPERGLLLLNMWRSDGDARRTYSDLLKKLGPANEAQPAREHA